MIDWSALEAVVSGSREMGYEESASLYELAQVVFQQHFSWVPVSDRQDLISQAVLKALEMIKTGNFDRSRSSLKNYLYTGMRNEMGNYLYRMRREVPCEELYSAAPSSFSEVETVPYSVVRETAAVFESNYGDYGPAVSACLQSMGFEVSGGSSLEMSSSSMPPEGYDGRLLEALVCMVVWKKREYCL